MGTGFAAREPEKSVIIAIFEKWLAERFLSGRGRRGWTRAGASQSRYLPKSLKERMLCATVSGGICRGAQNRAVSLSTNDGTEHKGAAWQF